jgi:E3 ubiquitin-protein ligase RNF5
LYRWLETQHTTCPVCLAGVSQENIIPLFIKGSDNLDPRNKSSEEDVPNRPNAQRPEAHARNPLGTGNNAGGNAQFAGLSFTAGTKYSFETSHKLESQFN